MWDEHEDLPVLTELKGEGHNFHAIGSVVLERNGCNEDELKRYQN